MIDFKEIRANINDGPLVLGKALDMLSKESHVLFVVDNCDQRLTYFKNQLGSENCASLTCKSSISTRELELEKWRAGNYKFLIVKNLYHSCAIVRSYILKYARSIIVTRNITTPIHIVNLLNEYEFVDRDALEFIHILTDFEFSYSYANEVKYKRRSGEKLSKKKGEQTACPICSKFYNCLAKTCSKCGFSFPHQSFTSDTELRIGIITADFNPLFNRRIKIKVFKNINYLIDAVSKNKNLSQALTHRSEGKSFDYSMISDLISNYEFGSLVCFTYNSQSKLTFLSRVPPSICTDLISTWEKHVDDIFDSKRQAGVKELLSNLTAYELHVSCESYGYYYDFNDIQRDFIKRKFIESDLVVQIMAQHVYKRKLKGNTSKVSQYAKELSSDLMIAGQKFRNESILTKAHRYINVLGQESKLLRH